MQLNSPQHIALLGATGSIGSQSLSVIKNHPDLLKLDAIAVHSSVEAAVKIAREFSVKELVIYNSALSNHPALAELPRGCHVRFGSEALVDICRADYIDTVVNAVVGAVGIDAAYTALSHNKRLAYANKESIVVAGELLMPLAKPGQIIPVDSEHSAIFQCLVGEKRLELSHIWLTCSGGPFFGYSREELKRVSLEDALRHPTWKMGSKISIDSATLMNKGLEIIEAKHLFNVDIDQIKVLIHPQSQIHSMVAFKDGSVKAQLGPSDMRVAIQYAFSYPKRWDSEVEKIDFTELAPFSFAKPDTKSFACLALAEEAGHLGRTAPCILNAANEIANAAFRAKQISFLDIEATVEHCLNSIPIEKIQGFEHLFEVDLKARQSAQNFIRSHSC